MKNLLLTIILLSPFTLLAQMDSTEVKSDTTRIQLGTTTILITDGDADCYTDDEQETIRDRTQRLTHWIGLDLGVNGFSFGQEFDVDPGDFEFLEVDLARSRSIGLNIAQEKLRIFGDHVGIFTGFGVEYNNYTLKNDYTLQSNPDTTFAIMDTTINLSKNKLRTAWVNVPLMLEFNTSVDTDKNFHLAAGLIGGWRLGTKYKQKFKKDGNRERLRVNRSFNMRNYKVDAAVRLGYRNFTLFATYAANALFEKDKTAEIYPFSMGLQLVGF